MQSKDVNVTEIIDSAKFVGLPLGIAILSVFIMLSDGFDLVAMGLVQNDLLKIWNITDEQMKPVIQASMWGMMLGSVGLGLLGDRVGRKTAYVTCLVFLFAGSLASAFATGPDELSIYRFITGIGLGGVTPLAAILISEWTPKRVRGVAVACVIMSVPLGAALAGMVARHVLPVFGWQGMFYIGAAAPFVFFVLAWLLLPESPRYLSQHPAKHPLLAKLLNRLLVEKRFDGSERFTVAEEATAATGKWHESLLALFKPPYLVTTLLLCAAFFANTWALYGYFNYIPRIFIYVGASQDTGLQAASLFSFGGFFGAVGGAILIGLYGSRVVGSSLAIVGGIATAIVAMLMMTTPLNVNAGLFAAIFVAGLAINGMQAFLYAVGANSYPTSIRAYGVGLAQTISRVGALIVAVVIANILTNRLPIARHFLIIAAMIVLVVITFFLLRGHMTGSRKNRDMEAEALRDGASP